MRRYLLPTVLAVVSLASLVAAVRAQPAGSAPPIAPAAETPVPAAPVLSPRRVPALLAQPAGTARLVQALTAVADASPERSCLLVTDGERVLFERQAELLLAPASGMKLVTAAAVLEHLDPGERLPTTVVATGAPAGGVVDGDLWMVGGGDPVLGTADWAASFERQPALVTSLEGLADRVVAAGVAEIQGRVLGDDSRYDAARYVAGWPGRYIISNQVGPLSALSVNDGFEAWEPKTVPFADPAAGAAGVFTELLRQRGVLVAGEPGSGTAPAGAARVAVAESPPVGDLVAEMLRESDNGTAELLTKELGFRVTGQGSTAAGTAAVASTVASLGDGVGTGVVVRDGSGLDPGDRVTCRLLHSLASADDGGPIDVGLPVAGTDGTLAVRFLDSPVTGALRAKTGSINGVASLSGVVAAQGGEVLSFSSILNDLGREVDALRLQDALATALVRFPDIPGLDELGPEAYPAAA